MGANYCGGITKSETTMSAAASRLPMPTPSASGMVNTQLAAAPPATDAGIAASSPSYRNGVGASVTFPPSDSG